jgi:hypothetical protein
MLSAFVEDQPPNKIFEGFIIGKINHHPNNQHQQYFSLQRKGMKAMRLIRQGQTEWCNFVNSVEIPKQTKIKYNVKLTKTQSWIMIGFCTAACLGNSCAE